MVRKRTKGRLLLFAAALIFGGSFVVVKDAVQAVPPVLLMACRYPIAAAVLGVIFCKRLKHLHWGMVWRGAVLGCFLIAASWVQTVGIQYTTPGKNAFLTAVYCILVPFMSWAVDRVRPARTQLLAAMICLAGIGMLSLQSGLTVGLGDSLSLVSGVLFGIHLILVAKFSPQRDVVLLTICQFAAAGLIAAAGVVGTGSWRQLPVLLTWPVGAEVLALGVVVTAAAYLCQMVGQTYADPASASLILSLESVFGVLFSLLCGQEPMTLRLGIGFALVFVAVLLSETGGVFWRRMKARRLAVGKIRDES